MAGEDDRLAERTQTVQVRTGSREPDRHDAVHLVPRDREGELRDAEGVDVLGTRVHRVRHDDLATGGGDLADQSGEELTVVVAARAPR